MGEVDKSLGRLIAQLRTQRNLSQTDLGRHLGVSFQQIQKYERGANRVSAAALMRITQLFDVSVSDVFQAISPAVSPPPDGAVVLAQDEVRLVRLFRELRGARQKALVVELLEALADHRADPHRRSGRPARLD